MLHNIRASESFLQTVIHYIATGVGAIGGVGVQQAGQALGLSRRNQIIAGALTGLSIGNIVNSQLTQGVSTGADITIDAVNAAELASSVIEIGGQLVDGT